MSHQEQLNFLLTNRVPRHLLTRLMGWYSRIHSPMLTRVSIAIWKLFAPDLNLNESNKRSFDSLHECFTRELKPGSRIVDADSRIVTSPCDAIVGTCGKIDGQTVYQAKGFPYQIDELVADPRLLEPLLDGVYVTLRLKSSMYHRFHAPTDCSVSEVQYVSGDTWNVNPITLKRIEKLFCKNERAVVNLGLEPGRGQILLVPVAAILVASMRFHCLTQPLNLSHQGDNRLLCNANYKKGDEMGYFEHGSTIIVFASKHYQLSEHISQDRTLRMGEALLEFNPG